MDSKTDDSNKNTLNTYLAQTLQSITTLVYGETVDTGHTSTETETEPVIDAEHEVLDLIHSESPDRFELCKHYISRKDRPRRGKREKSGRVTMLGTYYNYDPNVLEYFKTYKQVTRTVRSTLETTISLGYAGATGLIDGATVLTDTLLRKSYPPFTSDQIADMQDSSISFSGGGYNCAYHLGVVKYIFENPELFQNVTFLGASGGAGVAAIALAYQNDPNCMQILRKILDTLIVMADEGYTLSEQVDHYTTLLLEFIDTDRFDRFIKGSNRLQISVTDVTNVIPLNQIVTKFKDLTHLEETIRASACIPILLDDQIRTINNRKYLDGGLTNNLPALDARTIRISCLNYPTLQAEIHPLRYLNLRTCFVHPGEQVVLRMMEEGYIDFVKFMTPYLDRRHVTEIETEILELQKSFVES